MIYLSGCIVDLAHPMLGFMLTPQMGQQPPPDTPWAADNGRFAAPEKYTNESYFSWLRQQPARTCLFATAPDVLADHRATVALSTPVFPFIRQLGYCPAFVAQDGWDWQDTPWPLFDWFFLGGTTEFKLGEGLRAAGIAQSMGKRVHMGRANSYTRLCIAADRGCISADGTFLKFAPKINIPRMLNWFDKLEQREALRDPCHWS